MSVVEKISSNSSLTLKQVESLSMYVRVRAGEISSKEAAESRAGGAVALGSHYRMVQQAKDNVRASIFTVVAALWMGYVKAEDVRRLFDLVGRGGIELSQEEAEQFVAVLDALVDKIVM